MTIFWPIVQIGSAPVASAIFVRSSFGVSSQFLSTLIFTSSRAKSAFSIDSSSVVVMPSLPIWQIAEICDAFHRRIALVLLSIFYSSNSKSTSPMRTMSPTRAPRRFRSFSIPLFFIVFWKYANESGSDRTTFRMS